MRETDRELQLPPTTIRRWTIRRKAALLEALRSGALTVEKASQRYALSLEELRAWERDLDCPLFAQLVPLPERPL